MVLYHFDYYTPDYGWRRHYSPSREAVIIDRGEYVKYSEQPDWVKGWITTDLKPSPENICDLLNLVMDQP